MKTKAKFLTLTTATGDRVLRAYAKAAKGIDKTSEGMIVRTVSAGYLIPNGQKKGLREGWQVFVRLERYSDARFMEDPISGGLYT